MPSAVSRNLSASRIGPIARGEIAAVEQGRTERIKRIGEHRLILRRGRARAIGLSALRGTKSQPRRNAPSSASTFARPVSEAERKGLEASSRLRARLTACRRSRSAAAS